MTLSGFRLQPNWDRAFVEKDKHVWFHLYENDKTYYHKLERRGVTYIPDTDEVEQHLFSPRILQLTRKNSPIKTTFQSPDVSLTIHQCRPVTHLTSMDVSPSGELAISAASDHTLHIWETSSGRIHRTLEGHAGEIYSCRFFPSGLVALTASADMQLKIWCAVTGRCAATLAPGLAGAATGRGMKDASEPGGHRVGVLDTAIVHRGRNIVAVDRLGWLRLWDVATQICLSAFPVTPIAVKGPSFANSILEEVCCVAVRHTSHLPLGWSYPLEDDKDWYKVLSTSSKHATEVATSSALVAVGCGSGARIRLYELADRTRGCVSQLTLPHETGSIESCTFPMAILPSRSDAPVSPLEWTRTPSLSASATTTAFMEYGLLAGGQNGELAAWDLRQPSQILWQLIGDRGAVHQLKAVQHMSAKHMPTSEDENGLLLITGRSDGRVLVHPFDPTKGDSQTNNLSPMSAANGSSSERVLELTGIDCEPVRGMAVVAGGPKGFNLAIWTAAHSGLFHSYRRAALETAFGDPVDLTT